MLCREASPLRSVLGSKIILVQSASMRRIIGTPATLFYCTLKQLVFLIIIFAMAYPTRNEIKTFIRNVVKTVVYLFLSLFIITTSGG